MQRLDRSEDGSGPLDPELATAIDAQRSGGQELPAPVRAEMETSFGASFAGVRVHTGAAADRLSRSVQAVAFTTGTDVFFAHGAYDPAGAAGRELLAHELTHVVQQTSGTAGPGGEVSHPDDHSEVQARAVAARVVRGDDVSDVVDGGTVPASGAHRSVSVHRLQPGLQRYASGEHARQGDHAQGSTQIKVGSETLTSGEINALADLYATPDDMLKADPKELSAVLTLVRREAAGQRIEESEWDTVTGGRYTELNLKNSGHFSPRDAAIVAPTAGAAPTGQDNLSMFLKYYADAVSANLEASDVAAPDLARAKALDDRAVACAGFAEHYLMDAFSAGHLLNKDDFIAMLKDHLDKMTPAMLTAMFSSVAKGVLADPASAALLDQYETVEEHPVPHLPIHFHPNFSREIAFQGLLDALYHDAYGRQVVYNGLLKVVHDELSTRSAGAGLIGVEVQNKFETWILSGDKTLGTSADTQRIIDQALEKFRHLLAGYRAAPRSMASPIVDAAQVTDYFPHPTPASTAMISALVAKVTDPASGTGGALISILKAELPSILKALLALNKIRKS